jgi:hypothetical protein
MSKKAKVRTEKYAMSLYNKILTDIESIVGNTTTYATDLEKHGHKLLGVHFKGVFPSDKIPKLNDLKKYAIVNVDKSTEAGSHWMALAKEGDHTYLYDSFGRYNTKIIPNLKFSHNGRIIDTDHDAEQNVKDTNCGARSLAWLVFYNTWGSKSAKLI